MVDRRANILLGLGVLAACGSDVSVTVAATVRVDAALADEVTSLALFAFGEDRSDGIKLTCTTLMVRDPAPDDSRLDLLDRADLALTPGESVVATLDKVASGRNRLIYVEGENAAGSIIANGCTDPVTVESGKTVTIEVELWRFPQQ